MKMIKSIKRWITKRHKVEALPLQNTSHLYKTIDLPLSVFIDAIVDKDYSQIEDFDKIHMEYCELIGGRELVVQVESQIEFIQLQTKVTLAQCYIKLLYELEDEEKLRKIFDNLLELGYRTSVKEYSKENVDKLVTQIEPYVKLDCVDMQVLGNKLKINGSGKPYSRDYFAAILADINITLKLSITESITTRMYCMYVDRYKKHIEQLNKQK